ncbi:ABC transporter substrate-binding protein [Diaphorobacter aerolatus]|uniref:ABC transporter substrate-binding protein n=1 Tax=Diaphorobacter aerolatus TaxID=1288495 RepID=A0A7H0GJ10_9BURK|nr:ABC transporter substrate-binding protein [Diaphorobacter aerolatus]QNP48276.1 ABC transporter substrate-binding protein [Diaphorobacter aerolatus]
MTGFSQNVAVIAVLTGTTLAAGAAGISDDKVKIGVLSDMSGQYSDSGGRGSIEAARMAIEDFGGNVAGKPIELVFADHQNKADIGGARARQWWDAEGVDMIVDMNNSAIAAAVNTLAKERNKMAINTGAASTGLTNEFCAPTAVHYTMDSYSLANAAVGSMLKQGKKEWFILAVDYSYGKVTAGIITDFVKEGGGRILGTAFHPFNASDFSSFLVQAKDSGAQVVALANATQDTVNSIKTAAEFGMMSKQTFVPQLVYINDIHGLGLKLGQGLTFATGYYWDRNEQSREWAKKYQARMKKMPSMNQASVYSAVTTYLKAVQAAGTDEGLPVSQQLRKMKIDDVFSQNGYVREDGRMVHDMFLVQVKSPAESRGPWDYYKVIDTIPGDKAFQPLSKSTCYYVTKK